MCGLNILALRVEFITIIARLMSHSGRNLRDMLKSIIIFLIFCLDTQNFFGNNRLKSESHLKGESKTHSKSSDSHSKSHDSHFKSVDSHSKSSDFHSKSFDYHSDRKHSHQSATINKHHRDYRHGNSEHRASGTNAHRTSAGHDKKPSEHNTSSSSRELQQSSKPSRTPQKISTGNACSQLFVKCNTAHRLFDVVDL